MYINSIELAKAKVNAGMSDKDISAATGVNPVTISNIRNGKACRIETIVKIALALNVEPETLIQDKA